MQKNSNQKLLFNRLIYRLWFICKNICKLHGGKLITFQKTYVFLKPLILSELV